MNIDDLISMYKKKKKEFGKDTYRYISHIFREAKSLHKKDKVIK